MDVRYKRNKNKKVNVVTGHDKTWIEISEKALRNNVQIVRRLLAPETKLMAVVKSNAYGHGLVETAKLFSRLGVDWLGVDNVEEGISLRKNGIRVPILVMGYASADRIKKAVIHGLRFTIYDSDILRSLYAHNPKLDIYNLHLKIDTGMSRQGVLVSDLPKFLSSLPRGLNIEGVFTHFANAGNLSDLSYPNLQLANFRKAIEIMRQHGRGPQIIHADASPGFFGIPAAHFNMVRLGLALYGLWPSSELAGRFRKINLEPVLSWKTRMVQIKTIKKGTPVGYGITERVGSDTKIAVLPVGYYDGYDRGFSSVGEVLIGGKRCKILGRVSMNLSVVDISRVGNAKIWDEAVLLGAQGKERITAEELAQKIGTINYEVIARINPLLTRVYI